MFFDDHKKAVTSILSKRNSKGEVTMPPTEVIPEMHRNEDMEIDGRHAAAQDILGAHHSKSPEMLMHALGNFIDLHLHREQGNVPEPPSKGNAEYMG